MNTDYSNIQHKLQMRVAKPISIACRLLFELHDQGGGVTRYSSYLKRSSTGRYVAIVDLIAVYPRTGAACAIDF